MKKNIYILFAILLSSIFANAQQDAMFTHYMYNTISINPAYAGSRDALTIGGVHRSQWVGFEGAPITQTLSLHSPVFTKNIGLGLSVLNDKIGPSNNTSFFIDFSYRIKLKNSYLAFGLKSGANIVKVGLSEVNLKDPSDPAFASNFNSQVMPNFGGGIYYYTDKFYVGVSVPKLLQNNPFNPSQQAVVEAVRHYFFIAGTYFTLSESVKLFPTTFIKVAPASPIEMDFSANFIFKDKYMAGLMYRTGDAAGVFVGVNLTPQFTLGYSFDWSFVNKTGAYNAGSHEIMFRYDFYVLSQKKIRSPRYF
jgi:type IX secretion system PorP/SprF family membrane protein